MKVSLLFAVALGLPLFLGLAALGLLQLHAQDMAPLFLAMMLVDELARPEWLLLVCLLVASHLQPRDALAELNHGWPLPRTARPSADRRDRRVPTGAAGSLLLAPSAALVLLAVALGEHLSSDGGMALSVHRAALVPMLGFALFNLWSLPPQPRSVFNSPRTWSIAAALAAFYVGLLPLIWLVLYRLLLAHLAWWSGRAEQAKGSRFLGDYVDRLASAAAQAGALLLLFGLSMVLVKLANNASSMAPGLFADVSLVLMLTVSVLLLSRLLPPLVWMATLAPWLPWLTERLPLTPDIAGVGLLSLLVLGRFCLPGSARAPRD